MQIINDKIENCKLCPLSSFLREDCRPVCGIGGGNIMFITDCPRKEETILGEPITTKERHFLEKIISLDKLYITNLVKCNPINNSQERPPKKSEIKTCSKWLEEQIKEINPKVIIGAGKSVCEFFLKTNCKLDNVVGKTYTIYGSVNFIPSYSIKSLLNGSSKNIEEFKNIIRKAINCE